jgi:hypothetical protein
LTVTYNPFVSTNRSRLLWLALLIAVAGLSYGALSGHARFTNDRGGTDFNVFYEAGRVILDGKASELYSVRTERGAGFPYIYLPLFAVIMAPLSLFRIELTSIIWNLLSLLMILHSAMILYGGYFPRSRGDHALQRAYAVFLIAASVVFLSENLLLGQVHVLLLYLIVLAWKYERASMQWTAGALIGTATALKLLPGVFLLYFLLTRQYRALASMLATVLLCVSVVPAVAIGFETNGQLVREFYDMQIRPMVSADTTEASMYARTAQRKTLHDQDFGALLMRHFAVDHYFVEDVNAESYRFLNLTSLNTSRVRQFMLPVFAVLVIFTTVVYVRHRKVIDSHPDAHDLFFALFVLLSLLLSPRVRLVYLTVLMIPYGLLIRNLLEETDERTVSLSRNTLALSLGSVVLFSLPLFRALTVLYYGLGFLFFGLIRLLVAQSASSRPKEGSSP